jgi:hypothetical protein
MFGIILEFGPLENVDQVIHYALVVDLSVEIRTIYAEPIREAPGRMSVGHVQAVIDRDRIFTVRELRVEVPRDIVLEMCHEEPIPNDDPIDVEEEARHL